MALTDTSVELLDPTGEREVTALPLAPPPPPGATIALLDINKPKGAAFLDRLETLLTDEGYAVVRTAKPTFTKPAPADLRREVASTCTAVIEALAD